MVDPFDVVDSVGPVDPVDPVDPMHPVEAVDAVDPVDPVDVVHSADPVDPVDPVDGVDMVDLVDAVHAVGVVDAVDVVDEVDAVDGGCSDQGGNGGSRDTHECKYIYCIIESDTADAYRQRKCAQERGNNRNDERICFQCVLPGHIKVNCISYKPIKKWWKVKKATATAALTMTGDCNPFQLTACAFAAASKCVIDSGASHQMANDRSSFSAFKKLSLSIVIEIRDVNSVAATGNGFLKVIQGQYVEALNTPSFELSLLSMNQLDLGGHMTISENR